MFLIIMPIFFIEILNFKKLLTIKKKQETNTSLTKLYFFSVLTNEFFIQTKTKEENKVKEIYSYKKKIFSSGKISCEKTVWKVT